MPYIHIQLGSSINQQQIDTLQSEATALMDNLMGKRREVTMVHISSDQPGNWSVNGSALSDASPVAAYMNIKITQGTNSIGEKSAMIAACTDMLKRTMSPLQEACYVVVNEVPASDWGYNGLTQAARATQKISGKNGQDMSIE